MKQKNILLILSLSVIFFSCSQADDKKASVETDKTAIDTTKVASTQPATDTKFENTWAAFVIAAKSGDKTAIKNLSTDCILCGLCHYNTTSESKAYPYDADDTTAHPEDYYPVEKFIKEDFSIIFNEVMKRSLSNPSGISISHNGINRKLYTANACIARNVDINTAKINKVIVEMAPADTSANAPEQHGWTSVFTFIETKDGYKFCEYSNGMEN